MGDKVEFSQDTENMRNKIILEYWTKMLRDNSPNSYSFKMINKQLYLVCIECIYIYKEESY